MLHQVSPTIKHIIQHHHQAQYHTGEINGANNASTAVNSAAAYHITSHHNQMYHRCVSLVLHRIVALSLAHATPPNTHRDNINKNTVRHIGIHQRLLCRQSALTQCPLRAMSLHHQLLLQPLSLHSTTHSTCVNDNSVCYRTVHTDV